MNVITESYPLKRLPIFKVLDEKIRNEKTAEMEILKC